MFLGTYEHTLDDKNRLVIPSKIRVNLSKKIFLNKGFDGCLEVRKEADFKVFAEQLMSFSQTKSDSRVVIRQLLANAADLDVDNIGRVLLPVNLLQEVGIKKNIVIIGLGNKLEIWDIDAYKSFKKKTDVAYEKIAEKLNDKSF